jgi:membrane-bound serine protease (ClpP class)
VATWERTETRQRGIHRALWASVCLLCLFGWSATAIGQDDAATGNGDVKKGHLIDVPVPMSGRDASTLVDQLTSIAETAPEGQRVTVVLRYGGNQAGDGELAGDETQFEDALRVARAMTGTELRQVRVVSLVQDEVAGHSTLPIIASDMLIVGGAGAIVDASQGERGDDETVGLLYDSIGKRRGLFPPSVVAALVDPGLELAKVTLANGDQVFASGDPLGQLRQGGSVVGEEVFSAAGSPLRLDAKQLRTARIAAGVVDSVDQAAELLDLAELKLMDTTVVDGQAVGTLLEITGSIAPGRTRRWQSNLDSTLSGGQVNTWLISIDSIGGNLDDSATLAGWFASPTPPLRTVAGFVRDEARGDAALIALACKPLMMKPDARLGGPGAEAIDGQKLSRYDELVEVIATQTRRPAALIRGLIDPSLEVFRYVNQKTGRVRYATEDDIAIEIASNENAAAAEAKWIQGERIALADGLTAAEAITLGLADSEVTSLDEASRKIGLSGTPEPVADRGLVRFVERLGRNTTLSFLLLFIGFAALSAEANAPGLSFPGFIALVCFGLFFWMKFLAGTAEWLELVALGLGLICIAIELFVVPGVGIFGIGGLALTVLGIVLMSQTFVIPKNVYQLTILSRGIWLALGGAAGMVGGFVAVRLLLPHVPILNGLIMEAGDEVALEQSERLGDYSHLLGRTGSSTTPLRPSGKARFGDEIVAVVSDGSSIGVGESVRVSQVMGTKIVVEALED